MEYMNNEMIYGAIGLAAGVLMAFFKFGFGFLIKKYAKNKMVSFAIEKARDASFYIVEVCYQCVVKDAKEALADGSISKEEYVKILSDVKDVALKALMKKLGKPILDLIQGKFLDVEKYLNDLIEDVIDEAKK